MLLCVQYVYVPKMILKEEENKYACVFKDDAARQEVKIDKAGAGMPKYTKQNSLQVLELVNFCSQVCVCECVFTRRTAII